MTTDDTIATPEEMLSALERWADAKGWWLGSDTDRWFVERPTWVVRTPSAGGRLSIALGGNGLEYAVTPEVAIAWALTVEAGLEAVDLGPCLRCRGRGEWSWWEQSRYQEVPEWTSWAVIERRPRPHGVEELGTCITRHYTGPHKPPWGPGTRLSWKWSADGRRYFLAGPCPDCHGSGRDLRDPARLVLDAAPRPANGTPVTHWRDRGDKWAEPMSDGDRKAIEALTALADHLQPHAFDRRDHDPTREAAGHALAHLVALWLGRDLRETRASVDALTMVWERLTVPCEPCLATGRVRKLRPEFGTRNHPEACPDCRGHGRVKPAAVEPPGHTRLLVAAPPDPSNAHQWYQVINEQIVAYAMPRYDRGEDVQGLEVVVPTAVWFELRSTWRGVDHDISLLDAIVEYWRLEGISIVSDRGHRHGARAVAVQGLST